MKLQNFGDEKLRCRGCYFDAFSGAGGTKVRTTLMRQ